MKIKANIRAGRGANSNSKSLDNPTGAGSSSTATVVYSPPVYVPPVGRCVGI